MENQLTTITNQAGLAEQKSKLLLESFSGLFQEAKEICKLAPAIVVDKEDQAEDMARARKMRLDLRAIRTKAENIRKELKEQSLREGRAIDGISNVIKALIVPVEEYLERQEKFKELLEKSRLEQRTSYRIGMLSPMVKDLSLYNIEGMTDEQFEEVLAMEVQKVEKEKKRILEEQEQQKRRHDLFMKQQEEIRLENEKLKKEAEAREKKAEADRKKHGEELAKLRAEQQKKLDEEKNAREAVEANIKAEKDLKEKKELEEKQAIEAQKRLEEENKRQALLAPDKEKLLKFSIAISLLTIPALESEEARKLMAVAKAHLVSAISVLQNGAKRL